MPVPEGEPGRGPGPEPLDVLTRDRGGGLGGRSETEMLPEPTRPTMADMPPQPDRSRSFSPGMDLDPQTREVLAAAQDSGLVDVPSSFQQRPYWEAPEWPRNGREVGAWAAGVLATLEPESAGGFDTLHVQMRKDHVDGAVTALVDAGARVVRRSQNGRFVTLEVSRNPG